MIVRAPPNYPALSFISAPYEVSTEATSISFFFFFLNLGGPKSPAQKTGFKLTFQSISFFHEDWENEIFSRRTLGGMANFNELVGDITPDKQSGLCHTLSQIEGHHCNLK